ncbi:MULTISPECIES: hypothetical protein [unclassified Sphingomonas]|uniref:hypothetical protein n=1 Tax=Novosphingobium rhizosphaerae TaxID=1551649 RepID=UPI0015CC6C03
MKWLVPAGSILLSGCAPRTGDTLIDQVSSIVAPFSSCLSVGQTQIFLADGEPGPPALLLPESFRNSEVRAAAASIAIKWQLAKKEESSFFGTGSPDNCPAKIDRPKYTANFAFVTYSSPSGSIGAYAFRRHDGRWQKVEHVALGYW